MGPRNDEKKLQVDERNNKNRNSVDAFKNEFFLKNHFQFILAFALFF